MIKKEQEDMFETVELQTAQDVDTSPTDVVMSDSPDITSPERNFMMAILWLLDFVESLSWSLGQSCLAAQHKSFHHKETTITEELLWFSQLSLTTA